ncbi:MAG: HAMP domain-containing histidine kinase [Ichthyobacteriaceae bacterium]|nr:HAMP domain-containing histidine kinase [Ichthyobacteriaceae bacterium]
MNIYETKSLGKWVGLITAAFTIIIILFFTNKFVSQFKKDEQSKMEIWSAAMKQVTVMGNLDKDISFPVEVLTKNSTIPIINTYQNGKIKFIRNIKKTTDSVYLYKLLEEMKSERPPITIQYPNNSEEYVFYQNSEILNQLEYYPIAMLIILILFGSMSFWIFNSTKHSEQSLLWAAMAKETAHQIGTPLSSLMGWNELLKMEDIDQTPIIEIERDIERLKTIAERFSKIGSVPELKYDNIEEVTRSSYLYLKSRSSKYTNFTFESNISKDLKIPINTQLMSWVFENLIKNSIDAMQGKGDIKITLNELQNAIEIQIIDSGKGIPKSQHKTIFHPGFTTKKRGWGLGLSLAKRIIEQYHFGKIYVKSSEVGKGSTIAIKLNKTDNN